MYLETFKYMAHSLWVTDDLNLFLTLKEGEVIYGWSIGASVISVSMDRSTVRWTSGLNLKVFRKLVRVMFYSINRLGVYNRTVGNTGRCVLLVYWKKSIWSIWIHILLVYIEIYCPHFWIEVGSLITLNSKSLWTFIKHI